MQRNAAATLKPLVQITAMGWDLGTSVLSSVCKPLKGTLPLVVASTSLAKVADELQVITRTLAPGPLAGVLTPTQLAQASAITRSAVVSATSSPFHTVPSSRFDSAHVGAAPPTPPVVPSSDGLLTSDRS